MTQTDKNFEKNLTQQERELVERYRSKIGKVHHLPNGQEIMENEKCIYFQGLGSEASWRAIKWWATVTENYHAMWFDEEYAKKSRWAGIIAPPIYLMGVHDGLAAPSNMLLDIINMADKYPTNFVGGSLGESEWEFFEPVRPGDIIDAEHKLSELSWHATNKIKKIGGKEYSRILRVVGETTYINHKGQLVGHNRSTGLMFFQ